MNYFNWQIGELILIFILIGESVNRGIGELANWRISNMLPSKRSEQLERSLIREINNIIYRKINDPRIKFVTITRIKVSSDLKYADIFVTIYNDESQQKKALKGLKNATKFIRGELGKDLKMRYVPNIKFKIDEDLERHYKLLKIVAEAHNPQLNSKKDKNNE